MSGQFVYVIGVVDNPVKIGIARDLAERLNTLQIGCPDKMTIFHSLHSRTAAPTIETTVHKRLRPHHRQGEWFNVSAAHAWQTIQDVAPACELAVWDEFNNRDDLLQRILAVADIPPNVTEMLRRYHIARLEPGARTWARQREAAIMQAVGRTGWTLFHMAFVERKDPDVLLGRDMKARERAKIMLADALHVLCDETSQKKAFDISKKSAA